MIQEMVDTVMPGRMSSAQDNILILLEITEINIDGVALGCPGSRLRREGDTEAGGVEVGWDGPEELETRNGRTPSILCSLG
mgnify:CR=1 FL=1